MASVKVSILDHWFSQGKFRIFARILKKDKICCRFQIYPFNSEKGFCSMK